VWVVKIPGPFGPPSAVTGQTIDKMLSALNEKFRRPCSHIIFSIPG
jgi:hypothetical protein